MKAGGLDGLEFECYGHLIDQFWSPATNKRADEYGGSIDNRLRFGLSVFEAVRRRVGPDFLLGARLVCDEDWERGLSREEGMAIARRLTRSGLIDFLNVIRGHIDSDEALSNVIPGMGERWSPHLDFAGEVRAETRLPTFHAARIQDVATARHAIESGKLDMVGMTRAHLADPHIARKVAEGREAEIRPCVGMGYCIDFDLRRSGRLHPQPRDRPRGDDPARRFALRRAEEKGGRRRRGAGRARGGARRGRARARCRRPRGRRQAGRADLLAAALKRRREILGIVDWRVRECERLGVAFRFNLYARAEEVLALDPTSSSSRPAACRTSSSSIRATRSRPRVGPSLRRGAAERRGHRLRRQRRPPGLTAAEFVAESGAKLEIVTPERVLAPDVGGTSFPPYFRAFSRADAKITLNLRLELIARRGNRVVGRFYDEYGRRRVDKEADMIVVEHGAVPVEDLYFELKAGSVNLGEVDYGALLEGRPQAIVRNPGGAYRLLRIGDAVASRNIHAAVYDAIRFMKDI